MNKLCENCKHHVLAVGTAAYKHTNRPDKISVCFLKNIRVSPYNHCPKFEPLVEIVQLSLSYDANGAPVDEEV